MNKSKITMVSLEDLTVESIRLGRELEALVREACAGRNSREQFSLRRTLRQLANRNPFDGAEPEDLIALCGVLEKEAATEIVGSEQQFFETGSDMDGLYSEYRECPVYSV